jgi:phenylalanyl-tRNA synthetase beta chain
MRFSRNWIGDYTPLPADAELYEAMSMLGFVVDDAREHGDDITLDLDFPSNRPDAMNHLGIARELALASGNELSPPAAGCETDPDLRCADVASVAVNDDACPRFVARVAVDVAVGPSPQWVCDRLEAIGLRPINNIVDITNFVMWELGRPMHAYDLDKLAGHGLIVRRAEPGEQLMTLDEVERELDPDDLVIADHERVVGLAGVMGGAGTGVTESTTRVLLECACFDAVTTRRMARRHGMHTDASHRFERGMSPEDIDEAAERACALMQQLGGARIAADSIQVGNVPPRRQLELRAARLSGLLGMAPTTAETTELLEGLGYGVDDNGDSLTIEVPARRVDVHREVDLIEDVARLYGYERVVGTLPVLRRSDRGGPSPVLRDETALRQLATGLGYWEALTFVFGSIEDQRLFTDPEAKFVELANPLSEAFGVMRSSLVPGLLAVASRNHNVGERRVRLFEIGRAFVPVDEAPGVNERRRLALLATGPTEPAHWSAPERLVGFSDIKGAVVALGRRMRWPAMTWEPTEAPGLQAGTAATVLQSGSAIGIAGKVAPGIATSLGIEAEAWVVEIDITDLAGTPAPPAVLHDLPRFPASERDVSLLVPDGEPYEGVRAARRACAELPLVGVQLLDPEGHSVWTLRLTYRSSERTLTAAEIEAAHLAAVQELENALHAKRR